MNPHPLISPPLMLLCVATVVLGLPMGLYALMTRSDRRRRSEIRHGAEANRWQYGVRRWQGNPSAFRIDGQTPSGMPWKLTSGNRGYDGPGWAVELALRYPTLGGESDVAIISRDQEKHPVHKAGAPAPAETTSRIAVFSQTLAGAVRLLGNSQEVNSGVASFDDAYQVLTSSPHNHRPLVDAALAERILHWPADALAPHSVVAWRDPYGFVLEVRLPGPPNWATVSYSLDLGKELIQRLPPAQMVAGPQSLVDRMIGRFVQ